MPSTPEQPNIATARSAALGQSNGRILPVTSTRRRTIIREAQFPSTSVVTQYRGAREGL